MSTATLRQSGEYSTTPPRSVTSTEQLIRWGGIANMLAGVLTVAANLLHPPRSFATLKVIALLPAWEFVHALGILALVLTVFALFGAYAVQVRESARLGFTGFVLAVSGVILAVGVLAPDAFIFPVLAEHPVTASLLDVPGRMIPGGSLGLFMIISAVILNLGYLLFGLASLRAGVLPVAASLLILVGILPLTIGALAWPGIDKVGALLVGLGHLWWGYKLAACSWTLT